MQLDKANRQPLLRRLLLLAEKGEAFCEEQNLLAWRVVVESRNHYNQTSLEISYKEEESTPETAWRADISLLGEYLFWPRGAWKRYQAPTRGKAFAAMKQYLQAMLDAVIREETRDSTQVK